MKAEKLMSILLTSKQQHAIVILRIVVSVLMFIHGFVRVYYGGVSPFGGFLSSVSFPFGVAIAWGITIFELIGSVLLSIGLFVTPIAMIFAFELLMGIVLVHSKAGWFVVGLGRNGMEYSVLLITIMLALAYSHFNGLRNLFSRN